MADSTTTARRANRSGSLSQRRQDGRWVFMVDLGVVDGKRKRRAFYGATPQEAESRGREEFPDLLPADRDRTLNRSALLHAARMRGKHFRREWYAKLRAANGCHYCGATDVPLFKEHVVPLTRGGSDAIDNIVPACQRCNVEKGNRTPEEWKQ